MNRLEINCLFDLDANTAETLVINNTEDFDKLIVDILSGQYHDVFPLLYNKLNLMLSRQYDLGYDAGHAECSYDKEAQQEILRVKKGREYRKARRDIKHNR
jgi:hypothetical protein